MYRLVFLSVFVTGCSCQHGIGITGQDDIDEDVDHDSTLDIPVGDPVWDPLLEGLGEPGWRDSTEPYFRCDGWLLDSWSIWSDARGVFTITELRNPGDASWPTEDPEESPTHHRVAFNDGTGWRFLFDEWAGGGTCQEKLTGMPDGPLYVFAEITDECWWEAGTDSGITLEILESKAVHVVDETLALAFRSGGLLIYWDGDSWGPYPPDPIPYDVDHLWADHSSVWVAGDEGLILSEEDGGWRIHDTGTLEQISSLWGFADNDVWAGTRSGELLHWNGDIWENIEWPDRGESAEPPSCGLSGESIRGMWGSDGVLFFHTNHQVAMWDGADFTVIGYWPGEDVWRDGEWHGCENGIAIRDMWGNSHDEVFFAVLSSEFHDEPCGDEFLLWWDGTEFHWL